MHSSPLKNGVCSGHVASFESKSGISPTKLVRVIMLLFIFFVDSSTQDFDYILKPFPPGQT